MPPAARVGDLHTCPMTIVLVPHVGGPILPPGCPTVQIGHQFAARFGDKATCVGPDDTIVMGSPTVLIGNMMAARQGDLTLHGGVIALGEPTVLIGAPNGPFATADDAARAMLRAVNPLSIRDNREYSGLIYRGTDGNYYFTGPAPGTDQGANPYRDAPAPPDTQVVGDYHTHGPYGIADPRTGACIPTNDPARDDFNADNFSGDDKTGIAHDGRGTPGYAGYLGTPSGTFRKYDPATGRDTTL